MESSFSQNLEALFNKLDGFVSTKTIVGEPIVVSDTVLLPLIDVSVGLGAGAATSGGGGGLGAKIVPSAVISIQNGNVQLINIKNQDSINKIIDMAPGVMSAVNSFFSKGEKSKSNDKDADVVEEKKIITDL